MVVITVMTVQDIISLHPSQLAVPVYWRLQPPLEPSAGGLGWVISLPQSPLLYNEGCHHLQAEAAAGAGELDGLLCPLPAGPLQTEEAGEAD